MYVFVVLVRDVVVFVLVLFVVLVSIGLLFSVSESLYYYTLQRTPVGGLISPDTALPLACKCLAPTAPGTPARRYAYRRAVWLHVLCVHVLTALLSNTMLAYGICPHGEICEDQSWM